MGRMYIETREANGRCVVSDSFFTTPFKIAKPFYNGNFTEIMIMQASAGILEGDAHDIEFIIRSGSRVIITGQSYTKLFKMETGKAEQHVKITVEKNAELIYLPCPVIPFEKSDFFNKNEVYIEDGARLVIWDIFSSGRIAMGESMRFSRYQSQTFIYENNRVVFADNTRLVPNEINLLQTGFFEGYTHQGMIYFYGYDNIELKKSENIISALTNAKKGILMRVLAKGSDDIEKYLKEKIIPFEV